MAEASSALANPGPSGPVVDERHLLPRHLAGDERAFGELVDLLGGPVLGWLRRSGVPPQDAEELLQETFGRVHQAADRYQPDRPLKPWVFAIATNAARTWFRRRKVRQIVHLGQVPEEEGREPTGPELVEARETTAWLEAELARLPDRQRDVVLLCCVERLDQADVSHALGIPVSTVKTRLRRGRMTLLEARRRRSLQQERETS